MNVIYDYVWIWIGAAALLGFVVAWFARGIMVEGKRRDAEMQRDVAQGELIQIRAELDSLYATQRRQKEALARAARANLEDLRERDGRLSRLTEDLQAARAEICELRETSQALSVATEETDKTDELDAIADLKARNVYLEERVSDVEGKIHNLSTSRSAPAPVSDKRTWQVGYLTTRVVALEEKLIEAQKKPSRPAAPEKPVAGAAQDEELARLRWRNRYLEGRLAYFEEALSSEAGETLRPSRPVSKTLPEPSSQEADWQVVEPARDEEEPDVTIPHGVHPSDAFLEVLDRINDAGAEE